MIWFIKFLFEKILFLSLRGVGVCVIFSIILLLSEKFMTAKQKYYFLLIPLFMFILPINISLPKTAGLKAVYEEKTLIAENDAEDISKVAQNNDMPISDISPDPIISSGNETEHRRADIKSYADTANSAAACVYIAVIAALMLKGLYQSISFSRKLRQISLEPASDMLEIFMRSNKNQRIKLRCLSEISTPFVSGILFPKVFIPSDVLSRQEIEMALKHELAHIKKQDLLIKLLAEFICCIHFFNPFVYYLRNNLNYMAELSCDEEATRGMNIEERRSYGKMLLNLMKKQNMDLRNTYCLSENEKLITRRLDVIMKRKTVNKAAASIGAILAVIAVFSSAVFASAVAGLDNSSIPESRYEYNYGEHDNIYVDWEFDGKTKSEQTRKGKAIYSEVLGKKSFNFSYYTRSDETNAEIAALRNELRLIPDDSEHEAEYNAVSENIINLVSGNGAYTEHYELELVKVVREYGKSGSGGKNIEGLFTLKLNGNTVFENAKGWLSELPPSTSKFYKYGCDTTFHVTFIKDGKECEYFLSSDSGLKFEDYYVNDKSAEMKYNEYISSPSTREVRLGEALEVKFDGKDYDVSRYNEFARIRAEANPNNNYIEKIIYNSDMDIADAGFLIENSDDTMRMISLDIRYGMDAKCDNDTIRADFMYRTGYHTDDLIPITISGLSGSVGDIVEVKSDDGRFYAKYRISGERTNGVDPNAGLGNAALIKFD